MARDPETAHGLFLESGSGQRAHGDPARPNGSGGAGWRRAEGETAEDPARLKASFPTPRDAVAYIMDAFAIVKRRNEEKFDGDYQHQARHPRILRRHAGGHRHGPVLSDRP
jgi:hypothetical protein